MCKNTWSVDALASRVIELIVFFIYMYIVFTSVAPSRCDNAHRLIFLCPVHGARCAQMLTPFVLSFSGPFVIFNIIFCRNYHTKIKISTEKLKDA